MKPITEFYSLLNTTTKAKKVLITMHQKPDGDAMGSTLALYHLLAKLGHQVQVISPTNWASFLDWLPGAQQVWDYEKTKLFSDAYIKAADWIFCLDFNVLYRTKNMEPALLNAKGVKILIDHHEQPQIEAFDYGISIPAKSSTCEMIYDFIVSSGHRELIDPELASCIYTGLMTDTGSFRFPSTTASVHEAIADLKNLGLQHSPVHEHIYDSNSEQRLRFLGHSLLKRMEVLYEYNTAIMTIPKADLLAFHTKTGDTEGLVNYLLSIEGIRFGAIVIDRDEERKWSFRSKGDFDVNEFARKHFNGGGHKNAAGGNTADSLTETVQKFKKVLLDYKSALN
ncbi:bifunctional oligoribonuclease/PAP phosphatase NrnA [Arachidicoccus ginsenosidivorans]|jgi:phosphoesterase RecJ-like protein|uniref:Bifunctional oligoribonuclease/PAP phosphatase NrnA n=1 Tax=Arachidicoccus ginsenosidivorans TaxID=496057 RepID=A0A5B8VQ69_9BACT|nr:bifunctional oligoribonuclease/PAP phosphatase NrnA [Arachidicoccus ginsenosidivorans]QEC73393.1 bifunctional oligoribonuclease/PAP phosphatase NrnA [Arachidicoccus ginsenosidivorans]